MLLLSIVSFAQTSDARTKLLKGYSDEELVKLETADKDMYAILNFSIEKGYSFGLVPSKKGIVARTIKLSDAQMNNFNYLEHGIKITTENQYFLIAGTNKMLTIQGSLPIAYQLKLK
jgi:hypothetical protein